MSKSTSSTSFAHIKSYPLVKKVSDYALSFSIVAAVASYMAALGDYLYTNVVVKLPYVVALLAAADAKFDTLVLANLDKALVAASAYMKKGEDTVLLYKKKGEDTISTYKKKSGDTIATYKKKGEDTIAGYKKKGEDTIATYKKKGEDTVATYLKPVNDYASSTVDKVLPKAKDAVAKSEEVATNEISKSIEIVNDTLERTKSLITNKSSELSNAVITTYNKEFDASADKNYYTKVASASVSTGVTLLKSVNSDYIQPLKTTTQNYVSDVASHTREKAEEVVSKTKDLAPTESALNGLSLPVVSASA